MPKREHEADDFVELSDESSSSEETEGPVSESVEAPNSFGDMKLRPELLEILKKRGWATPTRIQAATIPPALQGRDIIGLAVTGSGKTGAFAIPIIESMMRSKTNTGERTGRGVGGSGKKGVFAAVVLPTRELCIQVSEEFRLLGTMLHLKVCALVGGMSAIEQTKELARDPEVLCATPGRLVDHLENTKGFTLAGLRFLVLDEADRLLSLDFEEALHKIVREVKGNSTPSKGAAKGCQTFLFSATMTTKLSKLQRACLNQPIKVEVDERTQTARNLLQYIVLVPVDEKFQYLAAMLKKFNAYRSMVFCNSCKVANVLNAFLIKLNFKSICLSGDMEQSLRLSALARFKNQNNNILIATEVAARGMDLPDVNYVFNFDVPTNHKDYIHRVGRTARAGRHGCAFTFVTKLDVVQYKMIEQKIFGDDDPDACPQLYPENVKQDVAVLTKIVNINQARIAAEKEYLDTSRRAHSKRRKT